MRVDSPDKPELDLSDVKLFRGLDPAALAAVASAARTFSVGAGRALFEEASAADAVYLPLTGHVKLVQLSDDGQAVVLRVVEPGEPLGIVAALQAGSYPASAIAAEPCRGVRIAGPAFAKLMDAHPRIALNALPIVVSRLHRVQEQFRELATERVERRIARVLLRLARQTGARVEGGVRIGMPLTRQDLAEMAGTTLFTVSRMLSRWEQDGLLESRRKQVLIRSPHALVAIAEDLPATPPRTDD